MNYTPLLYCQRDGLLSALLLGWKNVGVCGKIASGNSTLAYKWSFLLSLLYSLKDYEQVLRNKRGEKVDHYAYYRCIGRDSYRFGGNKICDNKHIRTDALETAVWEEVKHLLKNPNRILEEYKRRLSEFKKSSWDQKSDLLEKQENKLKRGIARLIDSYAQ